MIAQQEIKRIEQERVESGNDTPLTAEERNPQIRAQVVLKFMCNEQQIDGLLQSYPLQFGDGFTSSEDPDFAASVKKLCWYAMNNETVTRTFKKMLETPMTQMQKPTLISVSKVHANSVCVDRIGACTDTQLEPGMVDVPMPSRQQHPQSRGDGTVQEAARIPDQAPEMVQEAEEETDEL